MRKILSFLLLAAAFLPVGCGQGHHVLGESTAPGKLVSVSSLPPSGNKSAVQLQGVMVEKCPVAACWFRLRDKTGIVKVDVKSTNFTVTDVPLNAVITVRGVRRDQGSEPCIVATGIAY